MEVIKKKAQEDYIRICEANVCLENLFRTQQRLRRLRGVTRILDVGASVA